MNNARDARLLVGAVLLVVAIVLVRTAWMNDDAYITFRTTDNFLHGHGLRWNVADRVQTYTNPLWMLVMTAAAAITHDVYYTSLAVQIVLSLAVFVLVVSRVAQSVTAAVFGASALLLSKSFIEYSTSGLENPLTHLLVVLIVLRASRLDGGPRRLFTLSVLSALMMVNRLDTALLVAPLLVVEFWRSGVHQRDTWAAAVAGFLPLVAWELFAVIYYGFLFPNTAYAKLGAGIPHADLVRQGIVYLFDAAANDPLTPLLIAGAIVSPLFLEGGWPLPIGIASYVAYVVWAGGDFMSGRFLAAPLLLSVLQLIRRPIPSLLEPRPLWLGAVAVMWGVGLAAPRPPILTDSAYGTDIDPLKILGPSGIMDERRWYYPGTGLLTARRGVAMPNHKWLYMGYDLARKREPLFLTDAAGFIGYAAGPTVHLIDWNALVDPLLARLPAEPAWRVGHYRRPAPDGYEETLRTGRNQIRDPSVAAFYEKLRIITIGPVWSLQRFKTILAMNFGRYDSLIADYGRVHVQLADVSAPRHDGEAWNAAGAVRLNRRGVDVALPATAGGSAIVEASVSGNDTYRFLFLRGGRTIGEETIAQPVTPDGSLLTHTIAAPSAPFDVIRILPSDGDSQFSLGHLRLIGRSSAQ
jgi:arabinofuranosyltransferase